MTQPLTITLKTLTPLWTGGIDGTCDRLHETGLIGSLRWWYEALVRGLGGDACDPTEHRCTFNEEKYRTSKADHERQRLRDAGLCDACQIFGATGWQRRFRLQLKPQDQPAWTGNRNINVRPFGRNRGWYLYPGRIGTVIVTLIGDEQTLAQLLILFRFLEVWGNLGPRPQLGYGVFRIINVDRKLRPFSLSSMGDSSIDGLPDLRTFTFCKFRFKPGDNKWWTHVSGLRELRGKRDQWAIIENLAINGMVPVTPALKNYLRFEQNWSSVALPHWLFGTLRGDERMRSKVAFSWAYRLPDTDEWEIRGWVYLPNDPRGRASQLEVADVLGKALATPQNWQGAVRIPSGFLSATITYAPSSMPWQRTDQSKIVELLSSLQSEVL